MSAPTRRCYLHVGSPKTGTSYLQSVMWASRPALADQGLSLPLRGVGDHFRLTLLLRGLLDEAMDPPMAFDVLDRLAAELPALSGDRLLISHELLAPVRMKRTRLLLDVLRDYEVHLVITARDLARQVPAEWQQGVKHRATLSYDDFLSRVIDRTAEHFWAVQDVADIARRWGADLPPERVHVVTVPQRGAPPGTLLERFCSVLDIDVGPLVTDAARANQSMGAEQAELLRRVNIALGDRLPHPRAGYARVAKDHLGDRVLAAQDGLPLTLPSRLDDWVHEASRSMVDRIRARGYTVVGDLEELMPAVRKDTDDSAPVTEAAVLEAAVQAIASLLDQRHSDLEEMRSLRRSVRSAHAEPAAPAHRWLSAPRRLAGRVRSGIRGRR
jgi:hypothetical protein